MIIRAYTPEGRRIDVVPLFERFVNPLVEALKREYTRVEIIRPITPRVVEYTRTPMGWNRSVHL